MPKLLGKYYTIKDAENSLIAEPMEILAGTTGTNFTTNDWVNMLDNIMSMAMNYKQYFIDNEDIELSPILQKDIENAGMSIALVGSIIMVFDLYDAGRLTNTYEWSIEGNTPQEFDKDLHYAIDVFRAGVSGAINSPNKGIVKFCSQFNAFYNRLEDWFNEFDRLNDGDYTGFADELVHWLLDYGQPTKEEHTKVMKYLVILLGMDLTFVTTALQCRIIDYQEDQTEHPKA